MVVFPETVYDLLGIFLNEGERIAGGRFGSAAGGAEVEDAPLLPGEPVVGHGDDAKFFFDAFPLGEAQLLAEVVFQTGVIIGLVKQVFCEQGVFDEGFGGGERHYVDEGRSVLLVRPEVHKGGRGWIEDGIGGSDHPAFEMLEQVMGTVSERGWFKEDAVEEVVGLIGLCGGLAECSGGVVADG